MNIGGIIAKFQCVKQCALRNLNVLIGKSYVEIFGKIEKIPAKISLKKHLCIHWLVGVFTHFRKSNVHIGDFHWKKSISCNVHIAYLQCRFSFAWLTKCNKKMMTFCTFCRFVWVARYAMLTSTYAIMHFNVINDKFFNDTISWFYVIIIATNVYIDKKVPRYIGKLSTNT